MSGIWNLNLISFFDFYLASMLLVSLFLRVGQYRAIGTLALTGPGRWPRLLNLIKQHRMIFLTWATALPLLLALGLTVLQILASRVFWHHAQLNLGELADLWLAWPFLAALGGLMLAADLYCTFVVGEVDRHTMEKYFDEAEYWLRSWKAPVVRVLTFGAINPRQMVNLEVQKALVEASRLLNSSLWWVSVQIGLRVAFGLALWLTFALAPTSAA
jgi:hypothetical protein